MLAVVVRRFGGPEMAVVEEVDEPVAGPGEVVVEVAAVDVIGLDTAIRAGAGEIFGIAPPYVPGDGMAGTVVAIGEGVDGAWQGRRVAVATGSQGTSAERVATPVESLVPVPDGLGLEHAAAVVHDGRTARALHGAAAIGSGERVLVMPAASNLGLVLVQLAKSAGAEVLAVAGGPAKLAVAAGHGADVLLDYTSPAWIDALGDGIDVVFDGAGGVAARAAFEAVRTGGRYLSYGDASGAYADLPPDAATTHGVLLHGPEVVHLGGSAETKDLTQQAFTDVLEGRVRPEVANRYSLGQVTDAHRAQESRSTAGRPLLSLKV